MTWEKENAKRFKVVERQDNYIGDGEGFDETLDSDEPEGV